MPKQQIRGFCEERSPYHAISWHPIERCARSWRRNIQPAPIIYSLLSSAVPIDRVVHVSPRRRAMQIDTGPCNYVSSATIQLMRHLYIVLICSRCRITTLFASMKRSTQLRMHGSSLRSSAPEEIREVTHLRKHVSVRPWMAKDRE